MATAESVKAIPWWREPTRDQWYAWVAAWLGWTLDAFDFTVFLLIMVPISEEFHVPLTAVALVFSLTLWMRLVGAVSSGWVADRVGRKLPLMISILGYSLCNFIAGFSVSAAVPRAARFLHGCGVAGRGSALDGDVAAALPRVHGRDNAGLVGDRLSAIELDLRLVLHPHRLARHAVGRRPAGALGVLRAVLRQGAAGVGGEPQVAARRAPRGAHAVLQHLQEGNARQHADRVLVHGGRLRPLLLGPGAVPNPPAKGSRSEPGDARYTDHDRQRRHPFSCRVLRMGRRSLQPPPVADHSRPLVDSAGILVPADWRLHGDGGGLCRDGSVRRRWYGWPDPGLPQRAVSDRDPRHGLLLPPGGDLGRAGAPVADVLRHQLRYRVHNPDVDRGLRRGRELDPRALLRSGDQGQGYGRRTFGSLSRRVGPRRWRDA